MSLKIIGTGKAVPQKQVSNDDLAVFLDTGDEWIYSRTGIKNRFVCTNESLTDLASVAAEQAIRNARLDMSGIDLIICSTIGGDYRTPSLSCTVAERLGTRCPAFDVNAACTGFIYALEIAACYLDTGRADNILIICAEMMTAMIDWTDRNTCVLFGDGAAACVAVKGNALKYISNSASAGTSILNQPSGTGNSPFITGKKEYGYLHMQGQDVFRFAVSTVETEVQNACEKLGITSGLIDYFLLHQANKRIIESVRNRLRQPEEKFPLNIENYGNLSSVTIPLLLHEMLQDGRIKPGTALFASAFGAGLTYGSCVMKWE